jgi:hypothetical protein
MVATRHLLLSLALVATVAASFIDLPGDDVPEPTVRSSRSNAADRTPAPPAGATAVSPAPAAPAFAASAARPVFAAAVADLFRVHSWQPPPAPAPAPARVAAATPAVTAAPPLPFRYIGKLVQDGGVTAFVSLGTVTHVLRPGDLVAGYRVASISAAGMELVYLRLDEKQHLSFGNTP